MKKKEENEEKDSQSKSEKKTNKWKTKRKIVFAREHFNNTKKKHHMSIKELNVCAHIM